MLADQPNLGCGDAVNVRIARIQCGNLSTVDIKTSHWEPLLNEKQCKR